PVHRQAHAEDDMQRRLSEAIVHDEEDARTAPPAASGTWRAPGDVVIEEGFSHMTWGPQRSPRTPPPTPPPSGKPAEEFVPAPPADLRRGGRRMPEVEDFPPLAQREYR